jgi:hypothetical protein
MKDLARMALRIKLSLPWFLFFFVASVNAYFLKYQLWPDVLVPSISYTRSVGADLSLCIILFFTRPKIQLTDE